MTGKKFISLITALSIFLSFSFAIYADSHPQVRAFVERAYTLILGREGEEDGVNDWTDRLVSGSISAAEMIHGFVYSDEFTGMNKSDEEVVEIMYNVMLDRESDTDGFNHWMELMNEGAEPDDIIAGFVGSTEFNNVCNTYGINPGNMSGTNYKVTAFVRRAYTIILGREGETAGINDWTGRLLSGNTTAAVLIHGFVYSDEFTNKNLTNDEIIEIMYNAMLGRESDAEGFAHWQELMSQGAEADDLIAGFCGSQEFGNICSEYGINPGSVAGTNYRTKAFVIRCFRLVLNREPDTDGLQYWMNFLNTKGNYADEALYGFVFSAENLAKAQSNEDFVELLYNNCLGRESDAAGKADWVSRLESGRPRVRVFRDFVTSAEFTAIISEYNLGVDPYPSYLDNGIHTGTGIFYPGEGPVVCIDPGHQWTPDFSTEPNGPGSSVMKILDPGGAVGVATNVREVQLNLDVSLKLRDALLEQGYSVVMTRETNNVSLGNVRRASIANEYNADIMIRVHGNSLNDSSARGTLAVVASQANPYVGSRAAECQRLGTCLVNNMCAQTGFNNRGLLIDNTMTGNNWANMPCVLLEMGFMSNATEDRLMQTSTVQDQMVRGMVNGINEYFGR